MRIACWSGPRNISTAMMYAFAARGDFAVWDEPFYAPYLLHTGRVDPMRDEILASHEWNANLVGAMCRGSIPDGKKHQYLKLIALHMLPDFPRAWMEDCVHVHLIRHPARVVASYRARRDDLTAEDIGFARQLQVYQEVGGVVVDSVDIRRNPRTMLTKLCEAVGLDFDPAMLTWPAGGHPSDGIWAPHWYRSVHASTGFNGHQGPLPVLRGHAAQLAHEALPIYHKLEASKLSP